MGDHGQHGVAERVICTIVSSTRTMMLHQVLLWSPDFDMRLRPFAMEHTVYIWNNLPDNHFNIDGGICPLEIYTESKTDSNCIQHEKAWDCHAYVLDPRLLDVKNIPAWDHSTRLGQYIYKSNEYASTIWLIRNLRTGYISP